MVNQFFRSRLGQSRSAGGGGGGRGGGVGRGTGGGRGMGGGNRPGAGPSGSCVCPKCGHKESHRVGVRCIDTACPKCGTKMIRE